MINDFQDIYIDYYGPCGFEARAGGSSAFPIPLSLL